MNLRQLRYFCETVDAGSAAAAAERLHVAPTAISMQLAQLEEALGDELFDRSRRPMEPTALGRFLYPRAKELLQTATRLMDDTRAMAAGRAGSLAIGYTRSSIFSVLPRAVRAFRQTHPQVQLELIAMLSEHQPEQLSAGRIQVGIARYVEPPEPNPSLVYTPLFADRFCLAVPLQHPFSERSAISVAELDRLPLIIYPKNVQSSFAESSLRLVRRAGVEPIIAHEASEIHTALGLVASGLGCCLVSKSVRTGSRQDIEFVDIADLEDDVSTVFAVTTAANPSKLLQGLLESLTSAGRDIEKLIEADNAASCTRRRSHDR
jgi:LysR family transcriptional regulator, benzoate and cis,cis-muconate-responsive activator of ben and cat genes